MTTPLYADDAYLRAAAAQVVAHTPEGGIVLDRSLFYPTGGGQPGDSGTLDWAGGALRLATTVRGAGPEIVHVPAEPLAMPPVGTALQMTLDWDRRHRHMRMHTALHLLSAVMGLPVTGGAIGAAKGRLDFDMADAPDDRDAIETRLNRLIERDLPVSQGWITQADLAARPELVRTMSVRPPTAPDAIRLVRIGRGADQVDLQPCGGTHVARTGEIGALRISRIEKKGRRNRRITLTFDS